MRMRGRARPVPLFEDVVVPLEALVEFLQRSRTILKAHDVSWTIDAAAGHGQLHARPFLDLADPRDVAKLEPMAGQVYEAALQLGGTISGEHGCGLLRTQFLSRQFGDLMPVFREIKDAFDPLNVLNPGKVIGDDPHLMTRDLRRVPAGRGLAGARPRIDAAHTRRRERSGACWETLRRLPGAGTDPPLARPRTVETAMACNGCGVCRSREPRSGCARRFRALRYRGHAPRSRPTSSASLPPARSIPSSGAPMNSRQTPISVSTATSAPRECPSGVDVSSLMLEAKAAFVENHGLPPGDWMLSHLELWSRTGQPPADPEQRHHDQPAAPVAASSGCAASGTTSGSEGASHAVHQPRCAAGADPSRGRSSRVRAVVYFVDLFANYFDQELAEAVVAVLRQAGVNVYVPSGQRDSGMPVPGRRRRRSRPRAWPW